MKNVIKITKSDKDEGIYYITGDNNDYYPEISSDSTTGDLLKSISIAIPDELVKEVKEIQKKKNGNNK